MSERENGGVPDDALIRTALAGDDAAFASSWNGTRAGVRGGGRIVATGTTRSTSVQDASSRRITS